MASRKKSTVAISGDSVLTTPNERPDNNLENVIQTELYCIVKKLYNNGFKTFLSDIASEFDIIAAEVVLEIKRDLYPDIRFLIVIPSENEEKYLANPKIRHRRLMACANDIIFLESKGCGYEDFVFTNDYLIRNSSLLLAYNNAEYNGTLCAVQKAKDSNIKILNLFERLNDYFGIDCPAKYFFQDYPDIPELRYGSKGIIFKSGDKPYRLDFNQIDKVEYKDKCLIFNLKDKTVIKKCMVSELCRTKHDKKSLFLTRSPVWLAKIKKWFRI